MSPSPSQVYLDYNATTPLDPRVLEAMLPYLQADQAFGNPGRTHWAGSPAKKAILKAKAQVAQLINAEPDEIEFTSGGTESVNFAVKGIALPLFKTTNRKQIITSAIEHPCSTQTCRYLERYFGAKISEIEVDTNGTVNVEAIRAAASRDTALINIMHSSHEVGTLQPVEELAEIAREHEIPFHVDAVCSVGKNVVDVKKIDCNLLSLSGHKFYAPKGVGAVYISRKVRFGWPGVGPEHDFEPLLHGLTAKGVYRPGTPYVAGLVGMGVAAELAYGWNTAENRAALAEKRDYLWEQLTKKLGNKISQNGHQDPDKRSPNCLNVSFAGWDGSELLSRMPNMAASSGPKTKAVVMAMGRDEKSANGAIRLSLGKKTGFAELDEAVRQFQAALG